MGGFSGTTREKRRLMAHRLAMDKVHAITTLHSQGMSERRIAKTLNISRKAVRRHLSRTPSKDTKAPTGEAPTGSAAAKDTKAPTGSTNEGVTGSPLPSRSECERFRPLIIEKLEEGLTAQRIFQDLQEEHGFAGKYSSVRRSVHKLGQGTELPFRRIEVAAGDEMQVDYGTLRGFRPRNNVSRTNPHRHLSNMGYCPDYNRIERTWEDLHANRTRNHRCRPVKELMQQALRPDPRLQSGHPGHGKTVSP